MKKIIIIIVVLLIFKLVSGQTYNPSNFTVSNKSYGAAQPVPTDARSQFYDASNFVMRDYNGTTEVFTYLNLPKYRSGAFPIFVHSGGFLTGGGVWIGGVRLVYWFKDSTGNANLVRWYTDSTITSGFFAIVNNLSEGNSTTIKTNLSLQNVDNTSDATKNAASVTLTNHTISGSANTITNIGNASLTNSTIGLSLDGTGTDVTVTGSPASLGGSLAIHVPTGSASNRGVISTSDWISFRGKVDSTTISNDSVFDWHNGTPSFRYVSSGAANNGLSNSGGFSVLGQSVGAPSNPGKLLSPRVIPMNSQSIDFAGTSDSILINSQARIIIGNPNFSSSGVVDINSEALNTMSYTFYGSSPPTSVYRRANGTRASPTSLVSGSQMFDISGRGYGATGFSSAGRASLNGSATETWSDVAQGGKLSFRTTPNGTTTTADVVTIDNTGFVGLNITSPLSRLHVNSAPTATANHGTMSLGGAAFDGSTSGFFVGSSSGTSIAVNESSVYAGSLIDAQVGGVSCFKASKNIAVISGNDGGSAFKNVLEIGTPATNHYFEFGIDPGNSGTPVCYFYNGFSNNIVYAIRGTANIMGDNDLAAPIASNLYVRASAGGVHIRGSAQQQLFSADMAGVGIGFDTVTARLHIKGGTTVAGTAPMKIGKIGTPGILLATPEPYAVETDSATTGGHIYYTTPVGIRYQLDQQSTLGLTWNLLGNASTVDGTNFIGSTDNIPLNFKVNNLKSGRIGNATDQNTFLGYSSGVALTSGLRNVGMGYLALSSMAAGSDNVAIGNSALALSTSSGHIAIGSLALPISVGGSTNIAIGFKAMQSATTAGLNVAIGQESLNSVLTGFSNVAVGYQSLKVNTASNNTGIGYLSLTSNIGGARNASLGTQAMQNNVSGNDNTGIGYTALAFTTGNSNTAIGSGAGIGGSGIENVSIGFNAGSVLTTGSDNTIIGTKNSSTILTTGSNNTFIGANIVPSSASLSNNIILSDGAGVQRLNFDASGNLKTTVQAATSDTTTFKPLVQDASGNYSRSSAWFGTGLTNYSHNISTPLTGGTVNLTTRQYNIINPAGAILALTVNLPSSPVNNDVVYIKYTQAVTTVTYGNGTVVDGITSPVAGGLVVLVYDSGTTSWY